MYWDRQGQPITSTLEWGKKHGDIEYKRVAETIIERGDFRFWVSTVWVGIDMGYDGDSPVIFETMVFPSWSEEGTALAKLVGAEIPSLDERDQDRYSTEAEALEGHARMVEKWRTCDIDNQADSS